MQELTKDTWGITKSQNQNSTVQQKSIIINELPWDSQYAITLTKVNTSYSGVIKKFKKEDNKTDRRAKST